MQHRPDEYDRRFHAELKAWNDLREQGIDAVIEMIQAEFDATEVGDSDDPSPR